MAEMVGPRKDATTQAGSPEEGESAEEGQMQPGLGIREACTSGFSALRCGARIAYKEQQAAASATAIELVDWKGARRCHAWNQVRAAVAVDNRVKAAAGKGSARRPVRWASNSATWAVRCATRRPSVTSSSATRRPTITTPAGSGHRN